MNGQQSNAKSTGATTNGAVALIIDYSNGVQKSFVGIPWKHDMAVFDALQAADSISPGLTFEFAKSAVDRGGRDVGSVVSIDGVGADQPDQKWLIWVNRNSRFAYFRSSFKNCPLHIGVAGHFGLLLVTYQLAHS